MNLPRSTALGVIATLTLTLAACGGSDSSDPAGASPDADTESIDTETTDQTDFEETPEVETETDAAEDAGVPDAERTSRKRRFRQGGIPRYRPTRSTR